VGLVVCVLFFMFFCVWLCFFFFFCFWCVCGWLVWCCHIFFGDAADVMVLPVWYRAVFGFVCGCGLCGMVLSVACCFVVWFFFSLLLGFVVWLFGFSVFFGFRWLRRVLLSFCVCGVLRFVFVLVEVGFLFWSVILVWDVGLGFMFVVFAVLFCMFFECVLCWCLYVFFFFWCIVVLLYGFVAVVLWWFFVLCVYAGRFVCCVVCYDYLCSVVFIGFVRFVVFVWFCLVVSDLNVFFLIGGVICVYLFFFCFCCFEFLRGFFGFCLCLVFGLVRFCSGFVFVLGFFAYVCFCICFVVACVGFLFFFLFGGGFFL